MSEYQPRYRWRPTWQEKPDDFSAYDPGGITIRGTPVTIGRFYLHQCAEGMRWYWHMQAGDNGRERVNLSGLSDTAREAAREIETNYDALTAIYREERG